MVRRVAAADRASRYVRAQARGALSRVRERQRINPPKSPKKWGKPTMNPFNDLSQGFQTRLFPHKKMKPAGKTHEQSNHLGKIET